MTATARMSRKWMARMLIVSVAFGGFAGWCVYDAEVHYPAYNEMADTYNRLVVQEKQRQTWEDVAHAKGWPLHFEGEDVQGDGTLRLKTAWDIRTQYVMAGLCILILLPILGRVGWAWRRSMRADATGFVSIEGRRIPYSAIQRVDRSRWQRKSIALICYEVNGRPARTKIDDWIFAGGESVLLAIEAHLAGTAAAQPESGEADKSGEAEP